MQISQIYDRVDHLARAWEQFKSVNDNRLLQIEKKSAVDPLVDEQLKKIDQSLCEYKSRLGHLEMVASRPELGLSHLLSADDSDHQQSFNRYLRKGIDHDLPKLQQKSLSAVSDSDGGYLVTSQMSKQIIGNIESSSIMRHLASSETISTDSLDIIEDLDESGVGWVAETSVREDTKTPQIDKRKVLVHELYAQPKATQKLIDDAAIDIGQWLSDKIANSFAAAENHAFLLGDGKGKPRGILSYNHGKGSNRIEQINAETQVNANDLINLYYALDSKFAARASFLMHRNMLQIIRMLKDPTTGQYLWSPGLASGASDTLLGAKVFESADMPLPTEGNIALAFADFKASYKIVDRAGIRILRDPFTDKPFVKFYATKRVGGDVMNFSAIKLLKITSKKAD
jgi:HK97 family phage major capsid protein